MPAWRRTESAFWAAASTPIDVTERAPTPPSDRATYRRQRGLLIGDSEQHVGVAGLIERAVAGEVAPAKLSLGVLDGDVEPAREQIFVVSANRLFSTELQWMWVAPLGRSRYDNNVRWKAYSLAT